MRETRDWNRDLLDKQTNSCIDINESNKDDQQETRGRTIRDDITPNHRHWIVKVLAIGKREHVRHVAQCAVVLAPEVFSEIGTIGSTIIICSTRRYTF